MARIEDNNPLPAVLIDRLGQAERVAVLTGAGVSAESGIPTFRDAQTGLWAQHDPMTLASPEGYARQPALVWDWYQWRRELIAKNRPNPGHAALARLEAIIPSITLITQNVDGLHALAGSEQVLELHGNIMRNICTETGRPIADDWIAAHADRHPPPSPHADGALARPDVIWFGEALDGEVLTAAFAAVRECDIMISAGTSGAVQPAASLPAMARDAGAVLVDINPETTELSALADWHLAGPSAHWLPILVEAFGSHRE